MLLKSSTKQGLCFVANSLTASATSSHVRQQWLRRSRWVSRKLPISNSSAAKAALVEDSIGGLKSLSVLKMENQEDVGELSHSIGKLLGLKHLSILRLVLSDSNLPSTNLSSLTQLRSLEITCSDPRSLTQLPSSLEVSSLEDVKTPIEWPMFSNLGNLCELELSGCRLREIEFNHVLGQLENLQRLQVRMCKRLVRLSNLSSLKELGVLSVEYCPQLIEIESQRSSTGGCSSTERPIPDTLKLERLRSLRVYYCESVRKLPAIPNARRIRRRRYMKYEQSAWPAQAPETYAWKPPTAGAKINETEAGGKFQLYSEMTGVRAQREEPIASKRPVTTSK
ncbi:hypothetical protein NL676_033323 [Syzygium grande]|nr:hypothetical protein NL676_033323 [Syzygium grande]